MIGVLVTKRYGRISSDLVLKCNYCWSNLIIYRHGIMFSPFDWSTAEATSGI